LEKFSSIAHGKGEAIVGDWMGVGNVESGRAGERDMRVRNVGFDQLPGVAVVQGDSDLLGFEIVSTGEPLWFGQDRKQETLDEFFRRQIFLGRGRRRPLPKIPGFLGRREENSKNCKCAHRKLSH